MNVQTPVKADETLMANAIRALTMDAVQAANSGHPGAPMGLADVATVLFNRFIRIDPSCPNWPDRDRFVMSAGHGSMLVYAIHHLLGYTDMNAAQLRNFRQMGARTAGHPEYGHAAGIETTTGPLGQGISTAVGMALAERMMQARFGDDLVDHYTYVMAGDGCLMEGISHEAIDLAGHLGLSRLIVFWDDNRITIDGPTDLSTSMNQKQRFEAAGWHVQAVDGHAPEAIAAAIAATRADDRPSMIACRTVIGKGAPNMGGSHKVHGAPLGAEEIAATRDALDWPHAPFVIPDGVRNAWEDVAKRGAKTRKDWQARKENAPRAAEFDAAMAPPDAEALHAAITAYKARLSADAPKVATRKASELALEVVNATLPNSVGGSADLTGSNNTRSSAMRPVTAQDFSGDYIHYGIREHAMTAAMNGIALHGGFRTYGGTFLAFADYCRPAMRLSALMGVPVTYVMTHDSIGLGEDGPTHQPVETIASLRAMPNMNVIRPADAVETAEAWEMAATSDTTPTVLCLSRQGLPTLRRNHSAENMTARGAYVLRGGGARDVTLIATGSEVEIAIASADLLEADGIKAAVVSAPCFEAFAAQSPDYRAAVRGSAPRVGVEAAIRQGWELFLERSDGFIGMSGFGASAPAEELYRHFNITAEAIAASARRQIEKRTKA
ncbi:transketolase [Phaeobacter gallaeciensis]|uniref:transketolase n=1 Tax=Phaeobacter gallaeciensis TaxID=60890 RepID=UPI00237F9695|nr:transketolase [Phaeobacter gallaeciensis]MDE4304361.1 transketolase [Phaeobacter gallaeciensis]MDE4308296.1 transketolase [Phaeobacter gallaeciensis]MDE4312753.1 transketolase [Phaeobacter gallaeciensis]MDE4317292.1 transketolase [Phaeobacter gallaeciensis]MDE4321755.1 transketolase [Phaeobacter gallaeciensis]